MGRRIGVFCILLGMTCLLCAAGFVAYNHKEENTAEKASEIMLQNVRQQIVAASMAESIPDQMKTVDADGYDCIGVLSIPVLNLELPVLTDWSYAKLKIAPCHYYGTCYEPNFVIAAHNYQSHFGNLFKLQPKDVILFTDTLGNAHYYEVVLLETLPDNATEEMITSGFDLSLYTCTSGGSGRVTVRCSAISG